MEFQTATRSKPEGAAMWLRACAPLVMLVMQLLLAFPLHGQEPKVRVTTEKPPHYAGIPAVVQLTVDGLEASPDPDVSVGTQDDSDLSVTVEAISPRISQQFFQSGGKVRRTQRVTHIIQLSVIASEAGEYQVGPFTIEQGKTTTEVDAIEMTFQTVPATDDMRIRLVMPETAFPEQRVPVKVEWWFAGDTRTVDSLTIRSPLFDLFRFAPDQQASRSQSRLPIQLAQAALSLPASVRIEEDAGKEFTVVSAERTLVPDRIGTFEIAPIQAIIKQVTRLRNGRRQPFGFGGSLLEEAFGSSRQPASVERFRAEGDAFTFRVKPFPKKDQPKSFSGAVGEGFSVEASADRTVVRVGDPIRLMIRLKGDGNIRNATPPSLSADGGMNDQQFRLPEGEIAGSYDPDTGTKQFMVSVRVEDESINEIPGIAYSWFNPDTESYQTTRSKPIALRVMPASIVGADAVISSNVPLAATTSSSTATSSPAAPSNSPLTLSGADLSIQQDPDLLLANGTARLTRPAVHLAGYVVGCLFVAVAFLDRRRRQVPPETLLAAAELKDQRRRIGDAADKPVREGAQQISAALQTILSQFPDADRESLESIMSQCDSAAYQPDHSAEGQNASSLSQMALTAISSLKAGAPSA